jgi:hypothetical protein
MNFDLYNRTRSEIVLKKVHEASSFLERFIGLMLRKDSTPYGGLLFYRAGGIHTCFMRFSLDIVFVDKNMTVLKVYKKVGAFRVAICYNAYAAIEFKSDTSGAISAGDILELKNG